MMERDKRETAANHGEREERHLQGMEREEREPAAYEGEREGRETARYSTANKKPYLLRHKHGDNITGNFNKAMNALRDKAMRTSYAIKRNIKLDIPIKIWIKIVDVVIEPYGGWSGVHLLTKIL